MRNRKRISVGSIESLKVFFTKIFTHGKDLVMAEITLTPLKVSGSGLAVLMRDDDSDHEDWIPTSLIEDCDPEYLDYGDPSDFEIPSWCLKQKGFL